MSGGSGEETTADGAQRSCRNHALCSKRRGGKGALPPNLMAEDLFFLIAQLEAGALQLHEPLPGDIDIRSVQTRRAKCSIPYTYCAVPATSR